MANCKVNKKMDHAKYPSGLYFVFVDQVAGTLCYKCGGPHGCGISLEELIHDVTLRKIAERVAFQGDDQ